MIDAISLVVEAVSLGKGLAFELVRSKKSREARRAAMSLVHAVDPEALQEEIGPLELANYMRGSVGSAEVQALLSSEQAKSHVKEIVFATFIAEDRNLVAAATHSLRDYLSTELARQASQQDAHYFASQFAEQVKEVSTRALQRLREQDPTATALTQQLGLLRRAVAVVENILRHQEAVALLHDKDRSDSHSRFLSQYRLACAERHGYITPPDFETNRKIPLSQLYVVPQVSLKRGDSVSPGIDEDAAQKLEGLLSSLNRTVMLGDPGGGKSTLSNFLAHSLAKDETARLPLHVTLRDFASHSESLSIIQFIEQEFRSKYQVAPVDGLVESLLRSGQAVVFFDGLDELVDASRRREMTRIVELFCVLYPLSPVLVTSRRVGYDQARLDRALFDEWEISSFSDSDVERYVTLWFSSQESFQGSGVSSLVDSFISQSASVPDLRSNPLMLALMCIIFRGENYIPRNRPAVYEKCANLLFEKWDGHRGIQVQIRAVDHVNAAMKYLAYEYLLSGSDEAGLTESRLVDLISAYLLERAFETEDAARTAAQEFIDFCRGRAWVFSDVGTTAAGESLYSFTHRTFMEYFAAVHVVRQSGSPQVLASSLLPRVARDEWEVVAQLAVQQANVNFDQGSEIALRVMLNDGRRRSHRNRARVLSFIVKCLRFAVVSPGFAREVAAKCMQHRRDGRGSPSEEQTGLFLILDLAYHVDGSHQESVGSQICQELAVEFDEGIYSLQAVELCVTFLHWLPSGIFDSEGSWIRATIVDFLTGRVVPILEEFGHLVGVPTTFLLSGLAGVEDLRKLTGFMERSFVERVFAWDDSLTKRSASRRLPDLLDTPWDDFPKELQAGVIACSEWVLGEISNNHVDVADVEIELPFWALGYQFVHPENEVFSHPTLVVDASVTVLLAFAELVLEAKKSDHLGVDRPLQRELLWQDDEGVGTGLDKVLDRCSPGLARFADQWRSGQSSFFSRKAVAQPGFSAQ